MGGGLSSGTKAEWQEWCGDVEDFKGEEGNHHSIGNKKPLQVWRRGIIASRSVEEDQLAAVCRHSETNMKVGRSVKRFSRHSGKAQVGL